MKSCAKHEITSSFTPSFTPRCRTARLHTCIAALLVWHTSCAILAELGVNYMRLFLNAALFSWMPTMPFHGFVVSSASYYHYFVSFYTRLPYFDSGDGCRWNACIMLNASSACFLIMRRVLKLSSHFLFSNVRARSSVFSEIERSTWAPWYRMSACIRSLNDRLIDEM